MATFIIYLYYHPAILEANTPDNTPLQKSLQKKKVFDFCSKAIYYRNAKRNHHNQGLSTQAEHLATVVGAIGNSAADATWYTRFNIK